MCGRIDERLNDRKGGGGGRGGREEAGEVRQENKVSVVELPACLTPKQHASISQGRIYLEQVADQTFYLPQSKYTNTGTTSPRADPITSRRLAA